MNHTYTKNPVDVEAFQVQRNMVPLGDYEDVPNWIVSALMDGTICFDGVMYFLCATGKTKSRIFWGDYIINNMEGDISVRRLDEFEMTHTKTS